MKKYLAFLFLAILLTACASASSTSPLKNTSWELVSYGAIDNPTPILPGVDTVISFNVDGNLSGTIGCNSFFGIFEISEDKIEIGPIGSTEMYCEKTMDQEIAVFALLNGTLSFESDGNTLKLLTEDGNSALEFLQSAQ